MVYRASSNSGSLSANRVNINLPNNSVIHIGNSIAAFCNGTGSDFAFGSCHRSYVDRINMHLIACGQTGFEFFRNIAVGGTTLQQTIASQLPQVLANTDCSIVWDHSGVNNLGSASSNNDSLKTIRDEKFSLVDQIANHAGFYIVDSIQPVDQAGTTSVNPRSSQIKEVNAAFREICAIYPHVYFNDMYQSAVDPASLRLNPLANSRWPDGIHQTALGAYYMSQGVAEDLLSKFILNLTPAYSFTGLTNFAPTLGGGSGAGSTSTPGSGTIIGAAFIPVNMTVWIVSGSPVVTVSENPPNMTRLFIDNSASATACSVRLQVTDQATMASHFSSGKKIIGGALISISDSTLVNKVDYFVQVNGSSSVGNLRHSFLTPSDQLGTVNGTNYPQCDRAEFHRIKALTLSSNPTLVNASSSLGLDAGGKATFDVSDNFLYGV